MLGVLPLVDGIPPWLVVTWRVKELLLGMMFWVVLGLVEDFGLEGFGLDEIVFEDVVVDIIGEVWWEDIRFEDNNLGLALGLDVLGLEVVFELEDFVFMESLRFGDFLLKDLFSAPVGLWMTVLCDSKLEVPLVMELPALLLLWDSRLEGPELSKLERFLKGELERLSLLPLVSIM